MAAPVQRSYPLQFVSWSDVQKDPGLHFTAGAPPTERTLNILLGKNVEAGRIVAGVTFPAPGNWMSWPPHEHSDMLEEAYLYIDMPAPAFGIQLVYTDAQAPELAVVVREGDVVLMPRGYHPGVARARRPHQLPLDDGRAPRGRGPAVRRRQRPAGVRGERLGARPGQSEVSGSFSLEGRVALVTGASRGLGAAYRGGPRRGGRRRRRPRPHPLPETCERIRARPARRAAHR